MVSSKRIQIRLKPKYQERLRTAKTLLGVKGDSEAVRLLLDIGLSFYKDREARIVAIKKEMDVLDVKAIELGIIEKRKYLGR